jgi:hypothetical protein
MQLIESLFLTFNPAAAEGNNGLRKKAIPTSSEG